MTAIEDKARTLTELADRVEALSGPCRETDIAIHTIIDPQHVAYMDADYAETKAIIEALGPEAIKHRLPGLRSHTHNPPRYTASMDAAMTLVPERTVTANLLHKAIDQCFAHWRTDTDAMFRKRLPLYVTAASLRSIASQVEG